MNYEQAQQMHSQIVNTSLNRDTGEFVPVKVELFLTTGEKKTIELFQDPSNKSVLSGILNILSTGLIELDYLHTMDNSILLDPSCVYACHIGIL